MDDDGSVTQVRLWETDDADETPSAEPADRPDYRPDAQGRYVTGCCGALVLPRPFQCMCEYDAYRAMGG